MTSTDHGVGQEVAQASTTPSGPLQLVSAWSSLSDNGVTGQINANRRQTERSRRMIHARAWRKRWMRPVEPRWCSAVRSYFRTARSHDRLERQPLQAAACALWGFENLRYVRCTSPRRERPGVAIGRWRGICSDATVCSNRISRLPPCWLGWLAVWAAVALWWWQGRRQQAEAAEAERRPQIIAAAREPERARKPS